MNVDHVTRAASALRDVWVITIPDCLIVSTWSRAGTERSDEAAVELGALYQSCQSALHWSRSLGHARWVTIESDDVVIVLARSSPELVTVLSFDRRAPLGIIRMQARQVLEHVASDTGTQPDPLKSRVMALLDDIRSRAPEPRAAVAHLARRAGVAPERLSHPEQLDTDQLRSVLESLVPGETE
jgi:predicted regulator of Ras-like GTPase activity (Roadblock/LC7/MglB family)